MISTLSRSAARRRRLALLSGPLLAAALLAAPATLHANTWNPVASERLIKLPGGYLEKAIDNDFASSGLAASLRDVESLMGLKTQTLADLQGAIEQSEGALKTELRHQFLAEKRAFLELVGRHQDLQRQQMSTRMRLYERLLNKLGREEAAMTPERQALVEQQDRARRRLERSTAKVDLKLFSAPMTSQSKYAKEYAKNVLAAERLLQAIKAHPMNADSQLNGRAVTKQEYLRQLVAESQAELAIIDQEETILGYMAKLISLDALALSEELDTDLPTTNGVASEQAGITAAVDFFVPN